jgi:zinc/manganese transport system substrate-binding protein
MSWLSRRRALIGFVAASACAPAAPAREIAATFSILADFAQILAGDDADAAALVGSDSDVHVFEPTPAHAASVGAAFLLVENGLGFEPWVDRLTSAVRGRIRRCVASARVAPLMRAGIPDPHAWHDVANARLYVQEIAGALARAAPQATARIAARQARYEQRLSALDAEIRSRIGQVPPERRVVATSHDAFGYFERAYGVRFLAPLGLKTDQEPRPDRMAALIEQIRRENIRALFVENMTDPRVIRAIAAETRARIGGRLYSDALTTPDGPAPTYEAMMRANVAAIVAAIA